MSIFRPPAAPQVIKAGIAVLLPVVVGPTVPRGSTGTAQAMVAYRPAVQPVQAPRAVFTPVSAVAPPVIGTGSNMQAAAAYRAPDRYAQPLTPPASQWGIPDADLIFDRLWPISQQQGQPWPYAATARPTPKVVQPGAAAAAYLPPNQPQVQARASTWPHWQAQPEAQAAQFGIPDLKLVFDRLANGSGGGAIAWATQQAPQWPYVAAILPAPKAIPPAPVGSAFLWPEPAIIAPLPGPWPHALLTRPAPATFAFAQPMPPVRQTIVAQLLTQQPWPHRMVQPEAVQPIPTPVIQPPPQYRQWTPLPAPWPYALQQRAPVALAAPLPGYSVPPTVVLITPPPPPLRVLQPKFSWPMPDANAGRPVPWRAPVVANWFQWPHAVDEQMRLNLAATTAFLSDESPVPPAFDVASGPEVAINLKTREVLVLALDADGIVIGATRANGTFVKLRPVPGSNMTRARDKRGDLYLIV